MMLDTLLTNSAAVVDWLEQYASQVGRLSRALSAGDEPQLRELLGSAQRVRRSVFI
jgi:prephenate dehydrogenase